MSPYLLTYTNKVQYKLRIMQSFPNKLYHIVSVVGFIICVKDNNLLTKKLWLAVVTLKKNCEIIL